MILRLWRCAVAEEDVEPFDAFMQERLFPRLTEEAGCLSVTTAVDRSGDPPEIVAVSTWRSMEDLHALLGGDEGDEDSGVFLEEAHRFLAGDPEVVHLEVLAHRSG